MSIKRRWASSGLCRTTASAEKHGNSFLDSVKHRAWNYSRACHVFSLPIFYGTAPSFGVCQSRCSPSRAWSPIQECGTECCSMRPRSRTHIYLLIHHSWTTSDLLPCVFALLHSQVLFFSLQLEKNKADSLLWETVQMVAKMLDSLKSELKFVKV